MTDATDAMEGVEAAAAASMAAARAVSARVGGARASANANATATAMTRARRRRIAWTTARANDRGEDEALARGDGATARAAKAGTEDACRCWIDWGRRIRINRRRDEGTTGEVGRSSDEAKIPGKEETVAMISIDGIAMTTDGAIARRRAGRRRFRAGRRRDRAGLKSEKQTASSSRARSGQRSFKCHPRERCVCAVRRTPRAMDRVAIPRC